MNRNRLLIFSLMILIAISVSLVMFTGKQRFEAVDRDYFRIPETEKIDRVVLRTGGNAVEIKFENSRWRVNDRWDADARMVKVLFATLRQVEPRRPVAATKRDSVKQWLSGRGTAVSVYEGEVNKLSFVAGGNGEKTETWFLKEGDDLPYVMNIPGYRVYAAGIFELDSNGWRGKRIFDFNWRNFKSVSVTNFSEPKQSFEVVMEDKQFGIRDIQSPDTTKVNDFLDAVSLLFADRYVPAAEVKISPNQSADLRIEVKDIANRAYSLDLFKPGVGETEVFGRLASGEMVVFSPSGIGEIARRKDFFVRAH